VIALLALVTSGCGDAAVDTTTTTAATTTTTTAATTTETAAAITTTVDPNLVLEAELMAGIEAMAVALDSGDVDGFLELLQPSLSDAERERAAFFATSAPMHVTPEKCTVTVVSNFISEAECPVEIVEPVRLELGPAEGKEDFARYADGMATLGDGTLDPSQYTQSSLAYAEYLQQYLPEEYAAACDSAGYDTEIRYEYGVTLTRACGELLATVAEDVAEWIREGRPEA
jgi:hypothetical protein